ncbi:MAG: polysaccharide biosynthesis protein [Paracoccaceae bacterium]
MFRRYLSLRLGQKQRILLLLHILLVPLTFSLALALQLSGSPLAALREAWVFLPALMGLAGAGMFALGLHRVRLKDFDGAAFLRVLWLAAALGAGSWLLSRMLAPPFPAALHFLFPLVFVAGYLALQKLLLRALQELYHRSHIATRVAIYGTGPMAIALARELRDAEGIMLCAFLDDNPNMAGHVLNGVSVFAAGQIRLLRDQHKVNRVILAAPQFSEEKRAFLAARLSALGIEVQTLPETAQLMGAGCLRDNLAQAPVSALLARKPLSDELEAGCAAYRGSSVLITGAGGSIGRELCRQVLHCVPRRLVLLELSELALYAAEAELRLLAEAAGVELVPVLGSVTDQKLVEQLLTGQRVDVVLHAAAYKHVPIVEANARVGMANNALGTAVLARAAAMARVKRFVLVSSDKAVRPGNLMGVSKRIAELVVQDLAQRSEDTIFSIVRFGNVLGSSGSVIPRFEEQIARGGPVTLTSDRVTRYFMTIPEASKLVLLAGAHARGAEVFVLDMGAPVRIHDLARRMIEAAGLSVRDQQNPGGDIEIVTTGLRPGEKLHEDLFLGEATRAAIHPKILQTQEPGLSQLETAAMLRDLRAAIDSGRDAAVISVVVRTVHDYQPQSLPDDAPQMRAMQDRAILSGVASLPAE